MAVVLTPYVPRLVLGWGQDAPGARYRQLEGSMAFCDVSGFTALSERLARRGKVGAEELTEILDAVFSELLERAATFGGSMLKYGGDAVLVFFWGHGHQRRAAAAAAAMRAGLREAGRRDTSAGRVRLRMSVGVHSGEFDFFLVGDSHRELVVAGRAATLTCAMEAAAGASEILISPATAAALPTSCVGYKKGGGFLLSRAPTVGLLDLTEISIPAAAEAERFVPVALRRYLSAGGEEPEHRQATVAFIGFLGVDELFSRQGGEAVANHLEHLIVVVQRHLEEHGVTFLASDIYGDGGKVIAVAGAPSGWPNNDERMLRALRAIADDVAGGALAVHIGVNRGAVFTGDVGPFFRRTYTILGDAVNTAARVMAQADAGEVRSMRSVLDRSDIVFEAVEQEPFIAKGKAEPLVTYSVGAACGYRVDDSDLPLIGRDEELRVLIDAAAAAATIRGAAIGVVGDGGLGKSRLLRELRDSIDNDVLWTTCEEYESTTPYFALRGLLRDALALGGGVPTIEDLESTMHAIDPSSVPWLPLLATVFGVEIEPTAEVLALDERFVSARMERLFADLVAGKQALGAVWFLDDAQWLDAASTAIVPGLVDRLVSRGWLVVVSSRPGLAYLEENEGLSGVIRLGRLDAEDATALARAAAPAVLPQHLALAAERASGHPLFTLELAASLRDACDPDTLPDTVEAAITARIDALSPEGRSLLRIAAVLGSQFDLALLRQLEPSFDVTAIDEFVASDGTTAGFRQSLFQRAAYEGLPYRRRQTLHAAAGRILEASDAGSDLGQLSRHFHAAHDHPRCWHWARLAAEEAFKRFAPVDAVVHYRRALDAARHLPELAPGEVAATWAKFGKLAIAGGQLETAISAFAAARALQKDPVEQAALCLREGEARSRLGRLRGAVRWYFRGLRVVGGVGTADGAQDTKALLLLAIAASRLGQARYAEAIRLVDEAASLDVTDPLIRPHSLATRGVANMMLGSPEAERDTSHALAEYRRHENKTGEAAALNNLGMLAYYRGAWDEATELYVASGVASEASGDFVLAALTANNVGEIRADQGRMLEAQSDFEEALQAFGAARNWYAAYVTRNLGLLAARNGDGETALAMLGEAETAFACAGAEGEVDETRVARAWTAVLLGDGAAALSALPDDDVAGPGGLRRRRIRACASALVGNIDSAIGELNAVALAAAQAGERYEEALAYDALAALQDELDGSEHRDAADARFGSLGVVAPPTIPFDADTAVSLAAL